MPVAGKPENARRARCHPDRPHYMHNECKSCAEKTRRRKKKGQYKLMGLTNLGEELKPVAPTLRVIPEHCPKCSNECMRHYQGSPEVTCMICGYEGFLEPIGKNKIGDFVWA